MNAVRRRRTRRLMLGAALPPAGVVAGPAFAAGARRRDRHQCSPRRRPAQARPTPGADATPAASRPPKSPPSRRCRRTVPRPPPTRDADADEAKDPTRHRRTIDRHGIRVEKDGKHVTVRGSAPTANTTRSRVRAGRAVARRPGVRIVVLLVFLVAAAHHRAADLVQDAQEPDAERDDAEARREGRRAARRGDGGARRAPPRAAAAAAAHGAARTSRRSSCASAPHGPTCARA